MAKTQIAEKAVAVLAALLLGGCATLRPGVASTFRVMSYNIQAGAGHLDSTAQVIREQSPDIVALKKYPTTIAAMMSQFATGQCLNSVSIL